MAPDEPSLPLEPMLEAFRARLERGSPFEDERQAASDIALEAGPVLEALAFAWHVVDAQGDDPLGHAHEALAMLTLLGRRAAGAGVSPTAALAVAPALRDALSVAGVELPEHVQRALTIVCMEGYCAGRDDRARRAKREALLDAQRILPLVPGLLWWSASGPLDAEGLSELGDVYARLAFEHEARVGVLDLTRLREPGEEAARELLGTASQVRSLGARCLFVADARWQHALRELEPALREDDLCQDAAAALVEALACIGARLSRANVLTRLFAL